MPRPCSNLIICWKSTNWVPPSVMNEEKRRDPEKPQTKKGKLWYFGMQMHLGDDTTVDLLTSPPMSAPADYPTAHQTAAPTQPHQPSWPSAL